MNSNQMSFIMLLGVCSSSVALHEVSFIVSPPAAVLLFFFVDLLLHTSTPLNLLDNFSY